MYVTEEEFEGTLRKIKKVMRLIMVKRKLMVDPDDWDIHIPIGYMKSIKLMTNAWLPETVRNYDFPVVLVEPYIREPYQVVGLSLVLTEAIQQIYVTPEHVADNNLIQFNQVWYAPTALVHHWTPIPTKHPTQLHYYGQANLWDYSGYTDIRVVSSDNTPVTVVYNVDDIEATIVATELKHAPSTLKAYWHALVTSINTRKKGTEL